MQLWHWILIFIDVVVAPAAAGHALICKRDPRAALGWIAVCLLFPLVGPFLYFVFGINRVRTRAHKLHGQPGERRLIGHELSEHRDEPLPQDVPLPPGLAPIARVSGALSHRPLLGGNRLLALHNGEEAFPPMLEAIEAASQSVYLSTYIFETNRTGRRFIDALAAAHARGVDVRVLVDGMGELYSFPRASRLLRKSGVPCVRFLPPRLLPPSLHVNLRNHRKILVADGRTAFTGGMNIGDRHLAAGRGGRASMTDVHFRLDGPAAGQIRDVFLEDWTFATGAQELPEPGTAADQGESPCRVIVDGPNEDMDRLATLLVGASAAARERIAIMTPYFLPARELVGALQAAALRGLDVSVVLPQKSNLPFVDWATRNMLWELLKHRVRVYCQPPPFAHSKLFVVDGGYAQIGSANIDPRSLRLNFELAVEVFDETFAASLLAHFDAVRTGAREVSLEEVDGRPLWERARDSLAWLASPYL